MITIGLTTWTDHPSLIKEDRHVYLDEYAARFPVVEVDTSFYAIPTVATVHHWLSQVPSQFQFIVKANREMTLHPAQDRLAAPISDEARRQIFREFGTMIQPLVASNQLKTVLFQFPPYFQANTENFTYLRKIRALLPGIPLAIEFRNATWFDPVIFKSVLAYLHDLNMTLVAADEAQTSAGSVPFRLAVTNPALVMLRLHGRNAKGWGNSGQNWRATRTLYQYSDAELDQLVAQIETIKSQAKEVCVIFNNNAGEHYAAGNALTLQQKMHLTFTGLAHRPPEQMDLF